MPIGWRIVGAAALVVVGGSDRAWGQDVRAVWDNQCARCHGENGEGGNATSLLDDAWTVGGTHLELFDATRDGIEDLGMPAYGETLGDAEVWGLVVYLHELRHRHDRTTNPWQTPTDGVYTTRHHDYHVETVVDEGLQLPWAVAFPGDGTVLLTERAGRLRVLEGGELFTVRGTPEVWAWGQGGLMDVALHPGHAENGWVYLAHSQRSDSRGRAAGMTRVVRGRIVRDGDSYEWTDEEVIYDPPRGSGVTTGLHFGCRLVFDDGYLFFGIGERGRSRDAQDLSRPNGKIHRVHDDGRVPADNPFAKTKDALPTIWSYGHRNPQGLVMDQAGRLWETEHGPRGGDELNLIERGGNYGWPLVSFGINYNGKHLVTPWPDADAGITMPADVWLPSIAACGLSVGGARVGEGLFPEWTGDLFAGGLAGEIVERVRVDDSGAVMEREPVFRDAGRVRDVKTAPDGGIWIVLNGPDRVVRLVPAG